MELGVCEITVFFEDPFWVGLYERSDETGYEVCKFTFGAEPKDYEVYEALMTHWRELRFSPAISLENRKARRRNPKRERRAIRQKLSGPPIGTKAQQALKLQHEVGKAAAHTKGRAEREAEEARKFQLRQEKRKEKHRGH